jgi:UrcA family protein
MDSKLSIHNRSSFGRSTKISPGNGETSANLRRVSASIHALFKRFRLLAHTLSAVRRNPKLGDTAMNILKSLHPSSIRSIVLLSVLGLLGSAQALAAPPAAAPSVTVGYSDLDLSTAAGAHTLYHRIKGAARDVCGSEGRSVLEVSLWRSCVQGAIANAVGAVDSPLVTSVYSGKNRESTPTAMR